MTDAPGPKKMLWAGRIISALVVLFLVGGGSFSLARPSGVEEAMTHFGFPAHLARPIMIIEIVCAILYAIPQTAVLGAILLTGYLGGAVVTHLRIGDPWFFPVIFGVLVWLGIYLRDARLRALIPIRSQVMY